MLAPVHVPPFERKLQLYLENAATSIIAANKNNRFCLLRIAAEAFAVLAREARIADTLALHAHACRHGDGRTAAAIDRIDAIDGRLDDDGRVGRLGDVGRHDGHGARDTLTAQALTISCVALKQTGAVHRLLGAQRRARLTDA